MIAVRTGWRRCSTCISEPPPPTSARSATPGRRSAHAGVCRKNLAPPADGKVIAGQIGTADMSGAKQRAPVDALARSRYDNRGMYAIGSHEDGNALLRSEEHTSELQSLM